MEYSFDHLGIYDFIAVLIAGMCIVTFSILMSQTIFHLPWFSGVSFLENINFGTVLTYFVISFFIGLVFQEIGELLHNRVLKLENNLLTKLLHSTTDSPFSVQQVKVLTCIVRNSMSDRDNTPTDKEIFDYCRTHLTLSNQNMEKFDRDQATAGLSRSLAIYYILLTLFTIGFVLYSHQLIMCHWCIVFLILTAVLMRRWLRFSKIRYKKMMYTFLMYYLVENNTTVEKFVESVQQKN